MRKILFFMIACVMLVSMTACGKSVEKLEEYERVEEPVESVPDETTKNGKVVVNIENTATPDMMFAQALEEFYSDGNNTYYFNCIMSGVIIVTYEDGTTENVKDALNNGNIVIGDLDRFGIHYSVDSVWEVG